MEYRRVYEVQGIHMINYMNDNFKKYFSSIDLHFGDFIASFNEDGKEDLFLAGALLMRNLRDGHVCLDLKTFAGNVIYQSEENEEVIRCPQLDSWLDSLGKSPCAGSPDDFKPLILDENDRLYLQRYWQYEKDIAKFILARAAAINELKFDGLHLQEKLNDYFPDAKGEGISWQKVAATATLLKNFLIVSGGPGTGKTTTITKIIAFALEMKNTNLRIALTAPTGKAAARLQESVKKTKEKFSCPDRVKEMIPETASTIHRLLGSISGSPYFRFNKKNKLPFDLVIVDEASMIDLPLMAKLMGALPADAGLILLGDHNQLASVDAGVVLSDICGNFPTNIYSADFCEKIKTMSGQIVAAGDMPPGLQDSIIQLQQTYRFSEQSGIGLLSKAVRDGNEGQVLDLLQSEKYKDISWTSINGSEKSLRQLRPIIIEKYKDYLTAVSAGFAGDEKIFDLFDRFRILCALRVGSWGMEKINTYIEKVLTDEGMINSRSIYYKGRPVMIVQNDYGLNLFNGDVGLILKDRNDNQLKVFFRDSKGNIRKIMPARLPRHETVWAMTVHKSQGSEFEEVLLILSDKDVPVMTRELIYTGITRAVSKVNVRASREILSKAITRRVARQSGLAAALIDNN